MSNIQITENESGKYSPDWFYNEAQIPECISLAHKADELRENFINLFGVAKLKSLSGRELILCSITMKEIKLISAICWKWIKISTCLEVFQVDLPISLGYFIIKKLKTGPLVLH